MQNPSVAGMSQTITVKAVTEYGQTLTKVVNLKVEDTLTISGDSTLKTIVSQEKSTSRFTIAGGSGNTLKAETAQYGLSAEIAGGALKVSSASPMQGKTVTVTVTSAAGQEASTEVTVDVFSQLVFTSAPSGGAFFYAV